MREARKDAESFATGVAQNATWDAIRTGLGVLIPSGAGVVGFVREWPWLTLIGVVGVLAGGGYWLYRRGNRRPQPHPNEPGLSPATEDLDERARAQANPSFPKPPYKMLEEDCDELLIALLATFRNIGIMNPLGQKFVQIDTKAYRAESDPAVADRFVYAAETLIERRQAKWNDLRRTAFELTGKGKMDAREAKDRREKQKASTHRLLESMSKPIPTTEAAFVTRIPPRP